MIFDVVRISNIVLLIKKKQVDYSCLSQFQTVGIACTLSEISAVSSENLLRI